MIRAIMRKILPDKSFQKNSRLDHEPMYVCIVISLFVTGLSNVLLGASLGSVVSSINDATQEAMAWALTISSFLCIAGSLMGTRVFKPKADIRDCYSLARWSSIGIVVSMGVYGFAIFIRYENLLLSTVSGSAVIGIVAGILWKAWDFANEIDKLDEELRRDIEDK